MRAYRATVAGILHRNTVIALRNPALVLQPLVGPTVFLIAFAGGLATFGRAPGFDFPSGYTSFTFVFILVQAGMFNGAMMGLALARDLEDGFATRLLVSTQRRSAILVGYVLSGATRAIALLGLLLVIGGIARMRVDGSALETAGLLTIPVVISMLAGLWASGIALRFRTIQSAPLVFMPTFLMLFLTPLFVPLDLLDGWMGEVARFNPLSCVLQAGRGLISGQPADLGAAALSVAGLAVVLSVWALRGLRSAERAG